MTNLTAIIIITQFHVHRALVCHIAVFDNNPVNVLVNAMVVNSWAASDDTIVTATVPAACTLSDAPATAVDVTGCTVVVRPSHSQPATGVTIRVSTRAPQLTAALTLSVWFPSTTRVVADDAVLQSLLPHNANQPPAGCTDRFQSSQLRALANWTNGGAAATNTLLDIDVTDLVSFSSNDESGAMVSGAMVQVSSQLKHGHAASCTTRKLLFVAMNEDHIMHTSQFVHLCTSRQGLPNGCSPI